MNTTASWYEVMEDQRYLLQTCLLLSLLLAGAVYSSVGRPRSLYTELAHGLRAIVCVGETESEYRSKQTLQVVESQLAGSLGEIQDDVIEKGSSVGLVIAYEPVWAIGTGLAATPEIAVSVHAHIRRWLNSRFRGDLGNRIPILYGGSTTADNIYELCSRDNIDGALVGGASLKPDSFTQLCQHGSRALANR